jgi:hypothetical protein
LLPYSALKVPLIPATPEYYCYQSGFSAVIMASVMETPFTNKQFQKICRLLYENRRHLCSQLVAAIHHQVQKQEEHLFDQRKLKIGLM